MGDKAAYWTIIIRQNSGQTEFQLKNMADGKPLQYKYTKSSGEEVTVEWFLSAYDGPERGSSASINVDVNTLYFYDDQNKAQYIYPKADTNGDWWVDANQITATSFGDGFNNIEIAEEVINAADLNAVEKDGFHLNFKGYSSLEGNVFDGMLRAIPATAGSHAEEYYLYKPETDEYISRHTGNIGNGALEWLTRQTNLRTNHARMLTGRLQGNFLAMVSKMVSPSKILEIGTFTGYSAICLAQGLKDGGTLDTLEINDELEDLILEAFERAGLQDRIRLHIGDAKESILSLEGPYDLVYIDADKREYCEYYRLVFDKVRPGGFILADNVLWDGKVFFPQQYKDRQSEGIMAFNDMVAADGRAESMILPLRDGLTIIRKK